MGLFSKKRTGLDLAAHNFKREFGTGLKDIPNYETIVSLFNRMSAEAALSPESETSLLYRVIVMHNLLMFKLMRDDGVEVPDSGLSMLAEIINRSVDWSEKARDHFLLETATSQLNENIDNGFASLGFHRG